MTEKKLTIGGLFSGIGGFELAAQWAGIRPVWSNEFDPYCCKVLRKNFTHEIIENDIRKIKKEALTSVDIICGGFPCQPFSTAGQRKGAKDDRYLWPEMLRIIQEKRPTWVIGENVGGLVSMVQPEGETIMENQTHVCEEKEMVTETIRQDLARIGYETEFIIIPACAVGASHRRDRIWILSRTISDTCCNGLSRDKESQKRFGNFRSGVSLNGSNTLYGSGIAPNPNSIGLQGRPQRHEPKKRTQSINQQFKGCHKLPRQNWENFPTKSPICRRDDGVSRKLDKNRLKALGNAIVPQVAYEIFKAIVEIENRTL